MQALIFDLDGVIVDSESTHHRVLMAVLAPYALSLELAEYVGRADADAIRIAFRQGRCELEDEVLEALLEEKSTRTVREFMHGEIEPYAATLELLHDARARIPVAVCSAGRRREVLAVLDRLELTAHLAAVVTSDDVPRPKPAPDGYLLACRRLGVAPGQAIAIEDSVHGVAAARAAGLRVVAVAHTTAASRLAEADCILPTSADIRLADLLRLCPATG